MFISIRNEVAAIPIDLACQKRTLESKNSDLRKTGSTSPLGHSCLQLWHWHCCGLRNSRWPGYHVDGRAILFIGWRKLPALCYKPRICPWSPWSETEGTNPPYPTVSPSLLYIIYMVLELCSHEVIAKLVSLLNSGNLENPWEQCIWSDVKWRYKKIKKIIWHPYHKPQLNTTIKYHHLQ